MAPEDRPEPPEALPWTEAPWRAWQELSGERPHVSTGYAAPLGGMMILARPLPIPWSAIQAWCDRARCDDEERSEFIVPLVMAMDAEYLADWSRRQAKPAGQTMEEKLARWDRAD